MNKIIIPVCVLAVVGAGAFAIVKMNSASEAQARLDALSGEVAAQKKSLEDAIAGLKKAGEELTSAQENIRRLTKERDEAKQLAREAAENAEKNAGIAAAEESRDPDMKKAEEGIRNIIQGFAKQLDKPEVRNAMKSQQSRMIERAYEKMFARLNLPEADKALVADLISDRNMAAMDIGRKLVEGKTDEATIKQVRADIEATKAEYDTKLKSVLGEQKFSEMMAYEQTIGDERMLDFFARSFQDKNVPLQPEQREALLAIMREERLKNPSNEIPDLGGGPGMAVLFGEEEAKARQQQEELYQQAVVNRAAQAGLNPDQVTVLQDSFKQRNEMQTMGRAFGRAFFGGFGRPPARQ